MSKINTGSSYEGPYQWSVPVEPSITLRDWFAGQALEWAGSSNWFGNTPEQVAKRAYQLADAMLAQREKQP